MGKNVCMFVLVLLTVLSGACMAPPATPSAPAMINPGDKIGDFLVTTGETGEIIYIWEMSCAKQESAEVYDCKSTVGDKVNLSIGVYASVSSGKSLDTVWSEHTYEVSIGDRPVNLTAFGSIDVPHSRIGTLRHWNVVLEATKPGEITVHERGKVDGEAFEETTTYTFSAP